MAKAKEASRSGPYAPPSAAAPVLVGFDGAGGGRDALELARVLSSIRGARCIVATPDAENLAAEAREALEDPRAEIRVIGILSPAMTLTQCAEEEGAGTLVVGSTRRGKIGRALVGINAAILVFNLLPAFPLDGGRVARALIWGRSGDLAKATAVAASIGRAFGWGMIAFGLLATAAGAFGGLWFAVIGFFVIAAAKAEEGGLRVRTAFAGREAGRFMSFPAVTVPAAASVEDAVEDFFVRHRYSAFPVLDGGRLVGLIDLAAVERVVADRRPSISSSLIRKSSTPPSSVESKGRRRGAARSARLSPGRLRPGRQPTNRGSRRWPARCSAGSGLRPPFVAPPEAGTRPDARAGRPCCPA